MAAALGDLIQITDYQAYLGQQVLNVYYYRITAITGLDDTYLPILADWFDATIVDPVSVVQSGDLSHVSRELRNLSNGSDLYTQSTVIDGGAGTTDSANAPSYVSLGFILRRESLVTRNGYKRIAGLVESNISGNEFVDYGSAVSDIEDALAADVVLGVVTVAEPVIVKRPIEVPVGEYEYSSIGSAQFRGLGTQNSRKRGRGV